MGYARASIRPGALSSTTDFKDIQNAALAWSRSGKPGRQRVNEPPGLVERLPVFQHRVRVGHDAAAGAEIDAPLAGDGRADDDAGVERPGDAPVADGAAVDAAFGGLELGDD